MAYPILGILFDKDGTLFEFERTWNAWAEMMLRELVGGDEARASALGSLIGFDFRGRRFAPDSEVIAGTPQDIVRLLSPGLPDADPVDLLAGIATSVTLHAAFEDLPADVHEALAPYPEMRIWQRWLFRRNRLTFVQKLIVSGKPTLNPEYDAWRARRVSATRNELGWFGWSLDHPCHAVEMAVGCSVGCGFCAFDAPRLQTVFDLGRPENRDLVRDVAGGMVEVPGWPAAHGMLYWSTEPNDNPHYVKLLGVLQRMTGAKL